MLVKEQWDPQFKTMINGLCTDSVCVCLRECVCVWGEYACMCVYMCGCNTHTEHRRTAANPCHNVF